MTKKQIAGQKGGQVTASRYGSEYMASLGKQGGAYRDPTIEELRRMAEIKNNKKGGKCATVIKTESGELIRSKTGNMVKELGAVS